MKKTNWVILLVICTLALPAKADEGMWLLQMMHEKNLADRMKAAGLAIDVNEIYNPNGVSLKDAVGIFGGGCTGEIISPDGLILTNHHCGYGAIQYHSSVEHDYLTDGFWAKSREEELPTPRLEFRFVESIEDVTEQVEADIKAGKVSETDSFGRDYLDKLAEEALKASQYDGKAGISAMALPFYEGNKFYLFYIKTYKDVRMVAAPPQSIGKFGGETDNWMWPRHTCDFSMFRIYADAEGNPAEYSETNVPLKVKKYLPISIKGLEEGDYAMIMGFPGSTSRYLTESEVRLRMTGTNVPRIVIRTVRQDILWEEMMASDRIRIMYATKYSGSANYWKNSIGMNKAIVDNKVLEAKAEQEAKFAEFAKEQNNEEYAAVVGKIDEYVAKVSPLREQSTYFGEVFRGIEYRADTKAFESLKKAIEENDDEAKAKAVEAVKEAYGRVHNKDYEHAIDRRVAKALLPLFAEKVAEEALPSFYETIKTQYGGDYDAYVDALYDNTIFANETNLNAFLENPTVEAIDADLAVQYTASFQEAQKAVNAKIEEVSEGVSLLHKTYVRGLVEMYAPEAKSPDANFTMRMTFGNVKSYSPKDGVYYKYYTTLKGVMEKEDPNNPEFVVPEKLKELYEAKDYGRYALPNGEMPACFLTTNDITGGNSGSPVINGSGELIGAAFDGNWESLSGDINFDDNLQRCIAVDVRYILFVVEKLGGLTNLIDEMTIIE